MPLAQEIGVVDVQGCVEQVFGMEGLVRGDEYHINCPNPAHPDRSPSTAVNLGTGLWNCFSCGASGDLIELGVYALDLPRATKPEKFHSRMQVENMLKPNTPSALQTVLKHRLSNMPWLRRVFKEDSPAASMGPWEDGPLTYLRRRGFSSDTMRKWGCRFVPEQELISRDEKPFTIKKSIAIPIKDAEGNLESWCFRRTDSSPEWQPRYLYPSDAAISEKWGGIHLFKDEPQITVVEGLLDAMWCDQCGFPALALLGAQMGNRKILQLQRFRSGITLLGDRDNGGIDVVNRIGSVLGNRMSVRVARYPRWTEAKDPQELMFPFDLEVIHSRAVPWTTWVTMHASRSEAS